MNRSAENGRRRGLRYALPCPMLQIDHELLKSWEHSAPVAKPSCPLSAVDGLLCPNRRMDRPAKEPEAEELVPWPALPVGVALWGADQEFGLVPPPVPKV